MKLLLDESYRLQIREAIDGYLDDPSQPQLTSELVNLDRQFDALPTNADMGGALLVRCDGNVLTVSTNQVWDANATSEMESDPYWMRVAYQCGADRFAVAAPAFRALIGTLE